MKRKPRILFYDIETAPLQAWIWKPGKQVVRHNQLVEGHSRYGIICITYCFNDSKPAKAIKWDFRKQDTGRVVAEFDKVIEQYKPDVIIGKNSNRFDNKHINTIRMFEQLTPNTDIFKYVDDLEQQMRRYFYLPSYALDYISNELGLGGKIKMEMQDWIDIVTRCPKVGKKKLDKMVKYGKKDIIDTRAIWDYCERYFQPKLNMATVLNEKHACYRCGGYNIVRNGKRTSGKTLYQRFHCKDCKTEAGRAPISHVKGTIGRIGQ